MPTITQSGMELEIGGTRYGVELLAGCEHKTVRLAKRDGLTAYDVVQGETRTTCDCPDFAHRHAELDYSEGCKHVKACVKAGLVINVPAQPIVSEPVAEVAPVAAEPVEVSTPTTKPVSLVEKYRPRTLADLVGQDEAVWQLREFLADPVEAAFIFAGGTGVGKTSAAMAFAADLGCDVEHEELGGVYTIAAGDQAADTVRETLRSLRLRPLYGSGWKVLIVNEGDRMSESAQYVWLDALEQLPPKVVVIFTTNHLGRLPRRLVDRCECMHFTSSALLIGGDVQDRVNRAWTTETGRTDAPSVHEMPGVIVDGEISVRAALQQLNPLVRSARRGTLPVAKPAEPVTVETTVWTSGPATVQIKTTLGGASGASTAASEPDWDTIARRHRGGESLAKLGAEIGLTRQTLYRRLTKMGAK